MPLSSSKKEPSKKESLRKEGSSKKTAGSSCLPKTFPALLPSLDPGLSRALSRLSVSRPTPCQSRTIPPLSSGKDALVRSGTGSGKTLAYLIPIVNSLLGEEPPESAGIRAIILVPTRELTSQVSRVLGSLLRYCDASVSSMCLPHGSVVSSTAGASGSHAEEELRAEAAALRDNPAVVVATPGRLAVHVRRGHLGLESEGVSTSGVRWCVVDEADLVLSFGYADDLSELHHRAIPQHCQSVLLSATLPPSLISLGRVVLTDPVTIEVDDEAYGNKPGGGELVQYYLPVPRKDKNLVMYVFLRLGLLQGKGLFFVNSTDAAYRLKLFWEQFHIKSAVLNAELPLASRCHILEEFNAGYINYLIATDESVDMGVDDKEDTNEEENDEKMDEDELNMKSKKSLKSGAQQKKRKRNDSEYGAARGLDFRHVSFVVNFDFPVSPSNYVHRVGRTARGGAGGVSLSLVDSNSIDELAMLERIQKKQPRLPTVGDVPDDTLGAGAAAAAGNSEHGGTVSSAGVGMVQPSLLEFDLREIEGFRYRVQDVGRAVTKVAVRETRAAELRKEIMNSERLREHFEENPKDLQLLRHDGGATHVSKVQDHLKNIPGYMIPRGMATAEIKKKKKKRKARGHRGEVAGARRKNNDPLQSFDGSTNLDGVQDGGADSEFFTDDIDNTVESDGEQEEGTKNNASGADITKVFMDTNDNTGKSTSGRNAWKEKHRKGKFAKKKTSKKEKKMKSLGC